MRYLNAFALPELASDLPPTGVSVAIDVLRATTTITTALRSGAERVLPFETVEEALIAKRGLVERRPDEASKIVLGGERGGLPIEGFDFGNSPDLYTPENVEGKTLLFTTTNGTKAILSCRGIVLLAGFVNAEAVVRRILSESAETISIVCAGTNGGFTEEDLLLAGLLVDRLTRRSSEFALNVQAEVAREFWRERAATPLVEALKASTGGKNLRKIGLTKDIYDAANLDAFEEVAEFRVGEIKLDSRFKRQTNVQTH